MKSSKLKLKILRCAEMSSNNADYLLLDLNSALYSSIYASTNINNRCTNNQCTQGTEPTMVTNEGCANTSCSTWYNTNCTNNSC